MSEKRSIKSNTDPLKVVKCGCGLPMRQREWSAHWNGCRVGSSVEVTAQDVRDLEANERRLAERDRASQ